MVFIARGNAENNMRVTTPIAALASFALALTPAYALPIGASVTISKATFNRLCGDPFLSGGTIGCYRGCGNNICLISCTVNEDCRITVIAISHVGTLKKGALGNAPLDPPGTLSPVMPGGNGQNGVHTKNGFSGGTQTRGNPTTP